MVAIAQQTSSVAVQAVTNGPHGIVRSVYAEASGPTCQGLAASLPLRPSHVCVACYMLAGSFAPCISPNTLLSLLTAAIYCHAVLQVLEAIRGLRTIFSGKGAKLVPLKERPAAISVNKQAKAAIERDSWVRVRGGLYKDDLAKVSAWGAAVVVDGMALHRHHCVNGLSECVVHACVGLLPPSCLAAVQRVDRHHSNQPRGDQPVLMSCH